MKNFALLLLLLVVLDHVVVAEIDYNVVGVVVGGVVVVSASFSFPDVGTNQEHIHLHFLHSH